MNDNIEEWAIKGIQQELEGIKEKRIALEEREEALNTALKKIKGESTSSVKGRTYTISPEGRKRISEAQKARWRVKKKAENNRTLKKK